MEESKIAHLQMIQEAINRMAGNSLKMKEWCIGLSSALFGLAFTVKNSNMNNIIYLISFLFWFLDGYYLRLEKSFICLFEKARKTPHSKVDFCMMPDIDSTICQAKWWKLWFSSMFSFATFSVYLSIILVAHYFFHQFARGE